MGGLGSGGGRVGAGRKPKEEMSIELPDVAPVPDGLSDEQRAVWEELAPHAREARTLTPQTADAFRDLCELIVLRRQLFDKISQDGLTHIKVSVDGAGIEHQELKKHPLLGEYRGLMQRVEAMRKSFKLAPIGKAIASKPQDEKPQSALEKLKAQAGLRAVK